MNKRSIIAVIAGGLVAFIWSSISWMAIPWHQPTMKGFTDESTIGAAIKQAAPEPGIYTYPAWTDDAEDMQKKHDEGPYVFASIVPAGVGNEMGTMMGFGLLTNIFGAGMLLALMNASPGATRAVKIRTAGIAAAFIAIVPALMNWNWWHFPVGFSIVGLIDSAVSWIAAGLVMAMITTPKSESGQA